MGISAGFGAGMARLGGVPFTPLALPAGVLVAWHHVRDSAQVGGVSDGAAVSSWAALAGGDPLVQATAGSKPTYKAAQYGGRPRVVFDGVDDFLAGVTGRSSVTHVIAVGRARWLSSARGAGTAYPQVFADGYRGFLGLNGYDGSTANSLILTGQLATNNWFATAGPSLYQRNGVSISTAAADVGMDRVRTVWTWGRATAFSSYPLEVGRDRNTVGATSAWNGDACEILALNNPTAAQIAQVEAWCEYWRSGPIVAFTGDSLTAGYPVANNLSYPALFDENTGGALDCPNYAIPGQGLFTSTYGANPNLLQDDPAKLSGLPAGRSKAILVVWVGTNDLALGRSAAQVEANLWTYCDARRAEGWTVVVCTLIDRTDGYKGGGFDASRATLNAGILANYASHATAVVDLAANANLGPNGASANPTYYNADLVHLTATGYALVESLVRPVVTGLL